MIKLPDEFFHAFASLSTAMIKVAREKTGLSPIELFVLWHIRHVGAVDANDDTVIIRARLRKMLEAVFDFQPPHISSLLEKLQEEKLIAHRWLDSSELQTIFGDGRQRHDVIVLLRSGKAKIDELKATLRLVAIGMVEKQNPGIRTFIRGALPLLTRIAKSLVAELEPGRFTMLYGERKDEDD